MPVFVNLHPHSRWPLALLSAAMLAACGGGSSGESPAAASTATTRPVAQTDLQIASAIYSDSRTPNDFYAEAVPSGHDVVAKTHLKNTDVDTSIGATAPQFELCTDDWDQALSWSETSAQNAPGYSDLVATNDDARYFEFERVHAGTPELYLQTRIYKCTYLDRSTTNLRTNTGSAGQLNVRPLNAQELERLSEYLWQFTSYNNFGHAVLQSSGSAAGTIEHTLYIANLVRAGVSSSCDRIDVIAWRHSIDPATGAATVTTLPLWNFGAREAGGVAQLCS
jgi:hypothetical protein